MFVGTRIVVLRCKSLQSAEPFVDFGNFPQKKATLPCQKGSRRNQVKSSNVWKFKGYFFKLLKRSLKFEVLAHCLSREARVLAEFKISISL